MFVNSATYAAVFSAGAVSSIGPCVAPRFIAVAGVSAGRRMHDALLHAGAFVAGVVTLYASLGAAAAIVLHDALFSTAAYIGMAAALGACGIVELCRRSNPCEAHHDKRVLRGLGGAFLLGASSAMSLSPCCAPVLAAIAAYAGASGDPTGGALLLICYACGHSLPLFAAAATGGIGTILARHSLANAASLLGGTLMLALCAYYAVLA